MRETEGKANPKVNGELVKKVGVERIRFGIIPFVCDSRKGNEAYQRRIQNGPSFSKKNYSEIYRKMFSFIIVIHYYL